MTSHSLNICPSGAGSAELGPSGFLTACGLLGSLGAYQGYPGIWGPLWQGCPRTARSPGVHACWGPRSLPRPTRSSLLLRPLVRLCWLSVQLPFILWGSYDLAVFSGHVAVLIPTG